MARDIARGLGDTELVSIPKAMNSQIDLNVQRLGFVIPVYGWGLPGIVSEFLKQIKPKKQQYIFAVVTCGGIPGPVLLELRKILRKAGADLNAGFVAKAGANFVTDPPGFVNFAKKISHIEFKSGKERLPKILEIVKGNKNYGPEKSTFAANRFGGLMHGLSAFAADSMKAMDRNFSVDDRCKQCRTCERICPRANIKIVDKKPVWNHRCENCNACIQWCPQQAIHYVNETGRYRNPEVKVEDLMLR
jgi:Pyruvate/2-oxoacid:ferredoxin oxidoreductase delta subunit